MAEVYNRDYPERMSLSRWAYRDGSLYQYSPSFYGTIDLSDFVHGFTKPDWRALVRQHKPATTTCSGSAKHLKPGLVSARGKRYDKLPDGSWILSTSYSTLGSLWNQGSFPATPVIPSTSDPIYNGALTRFFADAYSKISQANGMTILGELRETVHQLKHPFSSLTKILLSREKRLRRVKRRLRRNRDGTLRLSHLEEAIADTWLESVFGFAPFVRDISDIASYLQSRRLQLGVEYYKISGYARSHSMGSDTYTAVDCGVSNVKYFLLREWVVEKSVRFKGEIKVDPLTEQWSRHDFDRLGLGLKDFLPTLWEITPWSFMVDYFTNVGDLINSFSVPLTSISWVNRTRRGEVRITKCQFTGTSAAAPSRDDGLTYYMAQDGASILRPVEGYSRVWERVGINPYQLPRPNISFDLPNGKQFVNTVALLASRSLTGFR